LVPVKRRSARRYFRGRLFGLPG